VPVFSFSSDEAAINLRSDRACHWPDGRFSEARLEGLTKVSIQPGFTFTNNDLIFTIGSCFVREIEKYLYQLGFKIPALTVKIPADERISKTANDILNKFSVHSMENELRWAFSESGINDEDFYLIAGEGKWHDGQMVHNLTPASLQRVIERRQIVTALMRQVPECRVIVITLGLAEAWFDTKTGLYLNGRPPQAAISRERNRFRLDVLAYDEIVASLERTHHILQEHGHPDFKMLITVSPVPFKASFSGKDALIANTYSKSVQRAAAEAFAAQHANVDYFPSYEMVTLTDRKVAYELDNIHVTRPTVEHIMDTVVSAYVPGFERKTISSQVVDIAKSRTAPSNKKTLQIHAKKALIDRDYETSVTMYSSLLFRFGAGMSQEELCDTRLNLGLAMIRASFQDEGCMQFDLVKDMIPVYPSAVYKLGMIYAKAEMGSQALEMFRLACKLFPAERDYHWRLVEQCIRMGIPAESVTHARKVLEIDPAHPESLKVIEKYGDPKA